MSNHRWKLGIDSDDDESLDSVDRTGTGAQFYDSSEFNDFMRLLDKETGGKKGRKEIRPMTAPAQIKQAQQGYSSRNRGPLTL